MLEFDEKPQYYLVGRFSYDVQGGPKTKPLPNDKKSH